MDTINCKWCNDETMMFGTGECDRCWELRYHMESSFGLAKKMLAKLDEASQSIPAQDGETLCKKCGHPKINHISDKVCPDWDRL